MEENKELEKPHKRRVRYKGTHPRKFEEKYKELQPEKYKDTIEKVIRKGSTPAGNAYIYLCAGDFGFFTDPVGTKRIRLYTWIRRTYKKDVRMSPRRRTYLWIRCGSD